MKYLRHSPSSLNLFTACPSMFVVEKILGKRQPVGAPAHRGTAIEEGVALGISKPETSLDECVAVAERKFRELSALSSDPRKEDYLKTVGEMVRRGIEELRPYGPPSSMQGFIEWRPEGLKYPIVGYHDFAWDNHGIVVDLKTTEKLPSKIKIPHARQVALYSGGNMEGRVTYVTPKKTATYRVDDIAEHRNALHKMALTCERFLGLSEDPMFFVGITSPDLESFYWTSPDARRVAFETWGV